MDMFEIFECNNGFWAIKQKGSNNYIINSISDEAEARAVVWAFAKVYKLGQDNKLAEIKKALGI
jgi:hypothetical protein